MLSVRENMGFTATLVGLGRTGVPSLQVTLEYFSGREPASSLLYHRFKGEARRVLTVFCWVALAHFCAGQTNGLDRQNAKKISDLFMEDLVASRVSDAVTKTSDLDRNGASSESVRWQYSRILSLCGKPVNSKSMDDGVAVLGEDLQSGGNKRTTLRFEYLCKTNHDRDQIFAVEMQMAEDGKYRVSGLSCRKRNAAANTDK